MANSGFDSENAVTVAAAHPFAAGSNGGAGASESISVDLAGDSQTGSDRLKRVARNFIALVDSGTPHQTSETREVLRKRLKIASILFFVSFLAFLPRFFFSEQTDAAPWIFWVHCSVTAVMGLMAIVLSQQSSMSLGKLRLAELVVFGDPALYFVVLTQQKLYLSANLAEHAHLPIVIAPWIVLIFTYALFIPNSWRRAAWVVAPLAIAPIAVLFYQQATCPAYRMCANDPDLDGYKTEQAMVMAITAVTAIVGVGSINHLRREAFEAKQLGQYRLKHRLGSGGMGEVYLAEHQMMKRPCAVKVIRPEKAGDPKTLARFEREVCSTAKLSHWNSIDIYDYGNTEDGTFYYVMEYLPGHNVGELIEQYGPMETSRVVYLMNQVCHALAEAHNIGLVHRDIKPANIFCAYRGGEYDVAKLLDFGLAKPTYKTAEETNDAALTQEGSITGSPLFMSPEQATGEREADARSDIYSLGAVLYYLATGEPPFNYSGSVKVIIAHASETAKPPREINPDLPEELEEIILRCLEKDPDHRFQDALSLRRALQLVPTNQPWSSEQATAWWSCNGCPERKAMAAAALEAAALGESCPWPAAEQQEAAIAVM